MDKVAYLQKQKDLLEKYEALCTRCGVCCGALGDDPCVNLVLDKDNKYFCKVYENRLGKQMTVSGKVFHCIPIRILRRTRPKFANCAYFK
jgi:hypothetical protein